MGIITLTTDFGLRDGYAGVLRGVIWQIAPQAQLADLTHEIEPQNILYGALILARHARFFPAGTVHLAVVDPGVGTQRRPLAGRIGSQYFCGPDNGLASILLDESEQAGKDWELVCLDRPEFWLPEVSPVFHGRDIFAPAAAHILNSVPLSDLGSRIADPIRISIPRPAFHDGQLVGEILYADSFGNLILNITESDLGIATPERIEVAGVIIDKFVRSYAQAEPHEFVCLVGSSGYLEIAEVNGSAAARLGVKRGDQVRVYLTDLQLGKPA